jgi:hypothetical protein
MLLNLSNHPSEKWSDKQRKAAEKEYGNIIDMPFPNIPPDASTLKVQEAADAMFRTITMVGGEPTRLVLHIMGEMTFTYKIVQMFKQKGFTCVASTSERNSVINEDGTKTIQFDFVQFRSY